MAKLPDGITVNISRLVREALVLKINIKGVRSLRWRLRASAVLFWIAALVAGIGSDVTIEVADARPKGTDR